MRDIQDIELASLCASGDNSAREELYRRYAGGLYAICLRYLGDRELAKDLMHDSMIKIFDSVGRYRPVGSLKSWCSKITINMVIDYIRKRKKLDIYTLDNAGDKFTEPQNDDVQTIPEEELMRMVMSLPTAKRLVFNLYCVENYSHKEIADMLGINEKTSSSLLFKSRKQLAAMIYEYKLKMGV